MTAIIETPELQIGDRLIDSTLPAGWYRKKDGSVVFCTASSASGKRLRQVKLGLLCLSVAEGITQVETWFGKAKQAKVLSGPQRPKATELLAELCRLHRLAECMPLPFWPQT